MKFPVPKTLIGAISPTLLINWIFGIGVIEYPNGRQRPIISAFWSLVSFLVHLSFVRMANFHDIMTFRGSKVAATSYRINAYVCASFIATSMLLSHNQTMIKVLKDSLSKLSSLNDRLKTLGIPNDYEAVYKRQIVHLCVVFLYIFVIMVFDFARVGFDLPNTTSRIGFLLASHHALIFAFVADSTFSGAIRYCCNRFQRLNALLVESDKREKSETSITQNPDVQFPYQLTVIRNIYKKKSLAMKTAEEKWLFHVVAETRRIHLGLCNTARKFNRVYGIQVLFSVALSLELITALVHTSYILVVAEIPGTLETDIWMGRIIALMWITFYASKVLRMVDSCEITTKEANRTGELIAKLLVTTTCDEKTRTEMNIFLLQLTQNPLNFTASGFFPLNYTLIHGMVGSVTTYLVIMIQMQTTYEPETLNLTMNSTSME